MDREAALRAWERLRKEAQDHREHDNPHVLRERERFVAGYLAACEKLDDTLEAAERAAYSGRAASNVLQASEQHTDALGVLRDKLAQLDRHRESRWWTLDRTTPSGKRLFRCADCGRESATPDKTCPAGCGGA